MAGIIVFACMVFAPLAGSLVDRVGKRASLMILGSLLMIPAHLLMGITYINPVICMVVLGAAFVLVPAAMRPSVPLIISENRVGTAFGLMTMFHNFGLGLFPWLSGALRDFTGDYTASRIMFSFPGVPGLIFSLLLKRADSRSDHILKRP